MSDEQRNKVILDAAQEMQTNERWWEEFEFKYQDQEYGTCSKDTNPLEIFSCSLYTFRRRPATITVTIPMPRGAIEDKAGVYIGYKLQADRDTALAAIREAMEAVK
jgi:hypothetical protein